MNREQAVRNLCTPIAYSSHHIYPTACSALIRSKVSISTKPRTVSSCTWNDWKRSYKESFITNSLGALSHLTLPPLWATPSKTAEARRVISQSSQQRDLKPSGEVDEEMSRISSGNMTMFVVSLIIVFSTWHLSRKAVCLCAKYVRL